MSTDLAVQSTELAPTNTLFGTDNPGEVIERAAKVAQTLADLVRRQNLIVRIGQSDHVRVEGWTLLGSMLGVFPIVEWTRPVIEDDVKVGWEARVEARTRTGEVVGAAEAECLRSEKQWSFTPTNKYGKPLDARDDYALRSMAQTRAVSKALRLPLGFVMQLAGFDPTPADEMPNVQPQPAVEVVDPGTYTFGEDVAPADPAKNPTQKQLTYLNMRLGGPEPQELKQRAWQFIALRRVREVDALILELGGLDEKGELHWSPLRETLTEMEAEALKKKLEALERERAAAEATA